MSNLSFKTFTSCQNVFCRRALFLNILKCIFSVDFFCVKHQFWGCEKSNALVFRILFFRVIFLILLSTFPWTLGLYLCHTFTSLGIKRHITCKFTLVHWKPLTNIFFSISFFYIWKIQNFTFFKTLNNNQKWKVVAFRFHVYITKPVCVSSTEITTLKRPEHQ